MEGEPHQSHRDSRGNSGSPGRIPLTDESRFALMLEVWVFQHDEFVLLLVVTILLVWRELRQGNTVGLDDDGHELVIVLGIAFVLGIKKIHARASCCRQRLGR